MVLVSIIMPVYNEEKFLGEAIESVLNQTMQDFEIIIVDDLSTDKTLDIANEFSKKDSRIKVYQLEKKGYRSGACNYAIRHSAGKYIAFLDGDDLYAPDKLLLETKFLNENLEIDLVYGTVKLFGKDNRNNIPLEQGGKDLRDVLIERSKEDLSDLRVGDFLGLKGAIPGASPMLRKNVFDECEFDENLKRTQDYDLWFQMIGKNYKFGELKGGPRYFYRIHEDQSILNKGEMDKARDYILKKLKRGTYFK